MPSIIELLNQQKTIKDNQKKAKSNAVKSGKKRTGKAKTTEAEKPAVPSTLEPEA